MLRQREKRCNLRLLSRLGTSACLLLAAKSGRALPVTPAVRVLLTAHPEVHYAVVVTRVSKGGNSAFKEPRLRIGFPVPLVELVNNS
jgi:hypothetical protein